MTPNKDVRTNRHTGADTRANARADARADADVAEIARLLPAPDRRPLPHAQHLHHKEQLMQHIDRDRNGDRTDSPAQPTRPTFSARRLLRPAVLLPVTALALAGILTTSIVLTTGDDTATTTTASRDVRPAAALLDQISDAAGKNEELTVRDDQFAYTRQKDQGADLTSGKAVMEPLKESESWVAQDPGPLRKLGIVKEDGETLPINAQLGDTEGTPEGFGRPTYHWLASLPTDPDKLLRFLYAKTPESDDQERDQAVFERIGGLLGGVTPPKTAAALYRAAAKIPGVTKAPAAHDAIGRHGVGIAREDTTFHTRTEWVFDRQDLTYLGSRSYLVKDTQYGKKGTLMSSEAVLDFAVVDKAGQEPSRARES
ncbi:MULTISPECIES: CU044_5270 family protein [unclassified Streptomyces]|uniref:CU044_5270 family protein n=1 Tax=unclassified Streptomyces TaxID=2593676 RepID=UPI002E196E2E